MTFLHLFYIHFCTCLLMIVRVPRQSKIYRSVQDCLHLQLDINSIVSWISGSSLQLNIDKTFMMRFCNPRHHPTCFDYHINGSSIKVLNSCKDLGVIFCSDLSWSTHIDKILSRAYQSLYFIKRTFPTKVKKLLYLSLVLLHVTYCSQVWRPYLCKDFIALENLQKRASKYIINDSSLDYKDRLKSTSVNVPP